MLIVDCNVKTFLFGSRSAFNRICYEVLTELKDTYDICRIYVRAEYPIISEEYKNYLNTLYEDSYFFDDKLLTGKLNYIKRNQVLIDKSDFCLFFYDKNYVSELKGNSGTALAYNYAVQRKKTIINIVSKKG